METDERLCDVLRTGEWYSERSLQHFDVLHIARSLIAGQEVEVDLEKDILTDIASGKQYPLKSIGEASLSG